MLRCRTMRWALQSSGSLLLLSRQLRLGLALTGRCAGFQVLYCARKAGVTHVLRAGGAQAVAAMAWGTETCPKVRSAPLPLRVSLVSGGAMSEPMRLKLHCVSRRPPQHTAVFTASLMCGSG